HHDQGEQDPAAAADPPVGHRRPLLSRNSARAHGLAARAHRLAARLRDLAAGPALGLPGPLIAGPDEPTAVIDEALPGAGLDESRASRAGPGQRGSRSGRGVSRGVSDRTRTPLWRRTVSRTRAGEMTRTAVTGRATGARVLRGCAHRPV